MIKEAVNYTDAQGTKCIGYLAYSKSAEKRPAILIAPSFEGLAEFARRKAETLAGLGYAAFAADLYGDGIIGSSFEENLALMRPLFLDRKLLQTRILAAFNKLKEFSFIDHNRIGAIGFCFGGLTVIELVRSGAPIRGAVSFHGALSNSLGDEEAGTVPIAQNIKSSLLICHGYDDPMVSQQDIQDLLQDLNRGKVDWQMHMYSHCVHAFTNPNANDPGVGTVYNELADNRSWRLMKDFFNEIFQ